MLEIGGGIGTDLSQFARNGARVTDVDLSAGHLALAQENFALRGLHGRFVHHDAESLPFDDNSFDVVYSNGVLHHTPNTRSVVAEIHRVLKPGGQAIVMMYAENSLHYWRELVWQHGTRERRADAPLDGRDHVARRRDHGQRRAAAGQGLHAPAAARAVRRLRDISIVKRQLMPERAARLAEVDAARYRRAADGLEPDHQGAKPRA